MLCFHIDSSDLLLLLLSGVYTKIYDDADEIGGVFLCCFFIGSYLLSLLNVHAWISAVRNLTSTLMMMLTRFMICMHADGFS